MVAHLSEARLDVILVVREAILMRRPEIRLFTTRFRRPVWRSGLKFFCVVEKVFTLATFGKVPFNPPNAQNQGTNI